jgi:predicted house-cleaning noncanonical NTP pyrophosphatase (MazG superfamily)
MTRVEKLVDDILNSGQTKEQHIARVEAFAREIRNEAIEEIATMVEDRYDFLGGEIEVALHIRQKTDALIATEDEK